MPGMLPDDLSVPHMGPTLGWGHMIGALALPRRRRERPDVLVRAELEDLLANFFWALDERRPDLLLDVLADRIVWQGSIGVSHDLGPVEGREEFIEWQRRIWDVEAGEQPRRLVMNTVHGGDPERAPETYSTILLVTSYGEAHSWVASGFVTASYKSEEEHWRIARVFTGWDRPPWRRKLSEMTSRELRLRLVGEKGMDD